MIEIMVPILILVSAGSIALFAYLFEKIKLRNVHERFKYHLEDNGSESQQPHRPFEDEAEVGGNAGGGSKEGDIQGSTEDKLGGPHQNPAAMQA